MFMVMTVMVIVIVMMMFVVVMLMVVPVVVRMALRAVHADVHGRQPGLQDPVDVEMVIHTKRAQSLIQRVKR